MNNIKQRNLYLERIRPFIGKKIIKVLSGVRRCGKSTIFELLNNLLLKMEIDKQHIINFKFTSYDIDNNFDSNKLYFEIKNKIKDENKYYLFLDEIQLIDKWDGVINKLFEEENIDIYLTGSNSKLMSSELPSSLSGRFIVIPIFTLSFKEYLQFKDIDISQSKDYIYDYIKFGGFPFVVNNNFSQSEAYQIVDGIYSSIISNDITRRHSITNKALFDKITLFIMNNLSSNFSGNSIYKFMKSENRQISIETIYNYITWLEEALIIYPCQRYDLRGKNILQTQEKYYLSDTSLCYPVLSYNDKMVSKIIENIVFLELKRRLYSVFIGIISNTEIDFVAEKNNKKIYVQVCRELNDNDIVREIENLKMIKDNYKKYLVYLDGHNTCNIDGIEIINLSDFLLLNDY